MIRRATPDDAMQLLVLNGEFNGKSDTTPDSVRASLAEGTREIVIVADEGDMLAGFVCAQLISSFCYGGYTAQITEVYVRPDFRGRGIAGAMIDLAEKECARGRKIHSFELLTGKDNAAARSLYRKLGYAEDGELHLAKDTGI